MCLAIPGKVTKIEEEFATVDYGNEQRQAMLAELDIDVGDYVLVQGGFVVQKIPKKDALQALKIWQKSSEVK